jgi:hypothetical protein
MNSEEAPPVTHNWKKIYLTVLVIEALLIAGFYFLSVYFV